jgi:hypothetical protein
MCGSNRKSGYWLLAIGFWPEAKSMSQTKIRAVPLGIACFAARQRVWQGESFLANS